MSNDPPRIPPRPTIHPPALPHAEHLTVERRLALLEDGERRRSERVRVVTESSSDLGTEQIRFQSAVMGHFSVTERSVAEIRQQSERTAAEVKTMREQQGTLLTETRAQTGELDMQTLLLRKLSPKYRTMVTVVGSAIGYGCVRAFELWIAAHH